MPSSDSIIHSGTNDATGWMWCRTWCRTLRFTPASAARYQATVIVSLRVRSSVLSLMTISKLLAVAGLPRLVGQSAIHNIRR